MATITPQELQTKVGEHLGTSDWVLVDQEMINKFADATGDHQFIHIDEEKAKLTPFGGTIAHGFLTLSLMPLLGASTDGPKVGGVAVQRRAIRTDDLVVVAEVEKNMRMIEGRIGTHAHEFLRTDLDDGHAGIIVKVGNDMIGHNMHLDGNGSERNRQHSARLNAAYHSGRYCRFPEPRPLICSCKFDTILSSQRSPSFVGAVVS